MKKGVFLLLLVFTTAIAFAQYQITGQVVDAESGIPLEGASVFAQNTTRGTITAKTGRRYRTHRISHLGQLTRARETKIEEK